MQFIFNRSRDHRLTGYTYFNPDAPQNEIIQLQYSRKTDDQKTINLSASYNEPLGKQLNLSLSYDIEHRKNTNDNPLYQLDALKAWRNMDLPLTALPPSELLQTLMNEENSAFSSARATTQGGSINLSGRWEKVRFYASATLGSRNDHLHYQRGETDTALTRQAPTVDLYFNFAYKLSDKANFRLYYYGEQKPTDMLYKVPYTDTSNPMVTYRNTPVSARVWNNSPLLLFDGFHKKRKISYYARMSYNDPSKNVVQQMEYDPVSGKRIYSRALVGGSYRVWSSIGANIPLDTLRRLVLTPNLSVAHSINKGCVSTGENTYGLSRIKNNQVYARLHVGYRRDTWQVGMSGTYTGLRSCTELNKSADQSPAIYEWNANGQVELPFGLTVASDIGTYTRRKYTDSFMNTTQVIWNAQVWQNFLKDKSLILKVEAVDILSQRTSEWSHTSLLMRNSQSTRQFMSYVLFHAIYRFSHNPKKK